MLTPYSYGTPPARRHVTRTEAAATLAYGCLLIAAIWLAELPGNVRAAWDGRRK